ncbi:pyrimidine dimer DNA glycosylase/endonuclease V [Aquamicrobium sp. LC103]|uniref:pyrimidine dimer DNA glycosylase/endonuclease V n=1 Tax=Aquamicrobium sp. LC103 TaxID=1120658 RepID=UPI00063E7A4A|nr:pyrimidine dimer DNA glycosylase/endonuclease V [Aquamicrobium sp. LC103]TKT69834.1 endonuclease V [Aquamicrobium sp. LC103]
MTRINCIPPAELTAQHLIAEYRELPRIFRLVRAAIARGERPDDHRNPHEYRLGVGHVRFFYSRLGYLARRQEALIKEMVSRGYSPNFTDPAGLLAGIAAEWCNDWTPSEAAIALNRARIAERHGAGRPGSQFEGP